MYTVLLLLENQLYITRPWSKGPLNAGCGVHNKVENGGGEGDQVSFSSSLCVSVCERELPVFSNDPSPGAYCLGFSILRPFQWNPRIELLPRLSLII